MIWRDEYRDRVLENPYLSSLEAVRLSDGAPFTFPFGGIILGAFSEAGAGEVAMWRKLLASTLPHPIHTLWIGVESPFVASSIPRSAHEFAYLTQDRSWVHELAPDATEKSFAIFTNPQASRIAFIGLPTEEGLDHIIAFLQN